MLGARNGKLSRSYGHAITSQVSLSTYPCIAISMLQQHLKQPPHALLHAKNLEIPAHNCSISGTQRLLPLERLHKEKKLLPPTGEVMWRAQKREYDHTRMMEIPVANLSNGKLQHTRPLEKRGEMTTNELQQAVTQKTRVPDNLLGERAHTIDRKTSRGSRTQKSVTRFEKKSRGIPN